MEEKEALRKFAETPFDAYIIYQLKNDPGNAIVLFSNMEWLKKHDLAVNPASYEATYTGMVYPLYPDTPAMLEALFTKFNMDRPDDFAGRSLSVSDVIVLRIDGNLSAHYVDSFGFVEIPDFLRDNPLKNIEMSMEDDYGMIDGILNNGKRDEPENRKSVMEQLKAETAEKPAREEKKPKKHKETER